MENWYWDNQSIRLRYPEYFRGMEWTMEDLRNVIWKRLRSRNPEIAVNRPTKVIEFVDGIEYLNMDTNLDNYVYLGKIKSQFVPAFGKASFHKDFFKAIPDNCSCVCDHYIEDMRVIGHVPTGVAVIVGNGCMKRWFGSTKPRYCHVCFKKAKNGAGLTRSSENEPPICRCCYEKRKKERTCDKCREETDSVCEPKTCASCKRVTKVCKECMVYSRCGECITGVKKGQSASTASTASTSKKTVAKNARPKPKKTTNRGRKGPPDITSPRYWDAVWSGRVHWELLEAMQT